MTFLELISEPKLRPSQLKEVLGTTTPPRGMTSTTYKFTNITNKMTYVGYHKETSKPYFSSSTNEQFWKDFNNPNYEWTLEILKWGSASEMKQYEYEYLTEHDAKSNPLFYNKHNGSSGTKQPDLEKVNVLCNDIDAIRQNKVNHQFKMIDTTYLSDPVSAKVLNTRPKIQTRSTEIIRSNIDKIKSKIIHGKGNPDPPVFLKDVTYEGKFYDWLLISGNHTITAYVETKSHAETQLRPIILTEDLGLNETEIYMLSNELNKDKSISQPYSKEDATKECLKLHYKGNSWKTIGMKVRMMDLGLTSNIVDGVFRKVEQLIINNKKEQSGMVVRDWAGRHRGELNRMIAESIEESDNTYVVGAYSSSALKMDKLYLQYHKEQDKRIEEGLERQTSIKCFVYHSSERLRDNSWPKLKSEFEYVISKEDMTPIEFVELEMYSQEIITEEVVNQ